MKPQQKSDFFAQLAALQSAGIPLDKALRTSVAHVKDKATIERVSKISQRVASGRSLAASGKREKVFAEIDAAAIDAGEQSGRLPEVFDRLASFYRDASTHKKSIKSRLALPALILLALIFLRPIVPLVRGDISAGAYLHATVGLLLKIVLALWLLFKLPSILRGRSSNASFLDRLLVKLPLFGKQNVRRDSSRWFFALKLLLPSGVPVLSALPVAAGLIQNSMVKKAFLASGELLEDGASWSQAFARNGFISNSAKRFLETGAVAGRLDDMAARVAEIERYEVQRFDEEVASWVPKLIYIGVLAIAAWSVLNGWQALLPRY